MSTESERRAFISYSRMNKDFASKLARGLRSAGYPIWFDLMDIPTGARWDDEVEKALRECNIFMVILTPASIASENVKDEIGYAIDHGKRILPVLLEDCDVPLRLRRFQYVDFTVKSFEEGFESAKELLGDLINKASLPISVKSETTMEANPEPAKAKPAPAAPVKKSEAATSLPAQKRPFPMSLVIGIAVVILLIVAGIGISSFTKGGEIGSDPAAEAPVVQQPNSDVTSVAYNDGASKTGEFIKTGDKTWEELNEDGPFYYDEINRDETSIYLFDSSRNVTLQLDLTAKVVNYDDGVTKIPSLYVIIKTK